MKFSVDESMGASISGGPLTERYILHNFHLHWGSTSGQGSEHTIDGRRLVKYCVYTLSSFEQTGKMCLCMIFCSYDGELHLVHYKSTFDNLTEKSWACRDLL